MQKLTLSDERRRLLTKAVKKTWDPIEIVMCSVISLLLFVWVYLWLSSKFRHEEPLVAWIIGPAIVLVITGFFCYKAYKNVRYARAGFIPTTIREKLIDGRNLWVNLAICSLGALALGTLLGDRDYWLYGTNIYSYGDLVSYVDIDPAKDSGQAYMDSGHAYFKENSYVLRQKFSKFRNGDTYCVAPIVRGSTLPESGTYDWWAVGTNCCDGGNAAKDFTCGQVNSNLARSGMRLLSDSQRPFYLLAVQEWSASFGLPVKHPLFFTWVKDPLTTEEQYEMTSDNNFWWYTWWFLLCTTIVSFLLHMVLHQNKIY